LNSSTQRPPHGGLPHEARSAESHERSESFRNTF
jgi:hypothetical protein